MIPITITPGLVELQDVGAKADIWIQAMYLEYNLRLGPPAPKVVAVKTAWCILAFV